MGRMLSTIRSAVRTNIEEPTANYWTDANLNKYINEGIRALNRRTSLLVSETPATLSFVADQVSYSLDSDCAGPWRIIRMQTDDGEEILPTDIRQMRSTAAAVDPKDDTHDSSTNPMRYYALGRKVGFYKKPDYDETDAIEYWFIETPTALSSDSDTSPFSDEEDDLVEFYATGRAFLVAQDLQKAQLWFSLYNAGAQGFTADVSSPAGGETVPPTARAQEAIHFNKRR